MKKQKNESLYLLAFKKTKNFSLNENEEKKSIKDVSEALLENETNSIKKIDMPITPYRTTYSTFAKINFLTKGNILRRLVDRLETCVKHGGRL
jgi:hypothetical protein